MYGSSEDLEAGDGEVEGIVDDVVDLVDGGLDGESENLVLVAGVFRYDGETWLDGLVDGKGDRTTRGSGVDFGFGAEVFFGAGAGVGDMDSDRAVDVCGAGRDKGCDNGVSASRTSSAILMSDTAICEVVAVSA
jgi:hypothetical protein